MAYSYKLTTSPLVIFRLEDGAFISADLGNSDYKDFLFWKASGNNPLPADIPVPLPDPSDLNNVDKMLKAISIYLGSLSAKTPAQVRAGILATYQGLP